MTNMSIQPLWLTHFIEILLVLEFQLTKFIVAAFSYKAHFRPQISSNNPKATAPENDNKGKRKDKYPYLLCGGDHFTKDFPRHEDISKFFTPTPAVLTDPFPSQQQLIDHMSNQGPSNSIEEIRMISLVTVVPTICQLIKT